jgi:hypothetical protein
MPILVQWKWIEKTKSFLVIFHFYDDYSKSNLRLKERRIAGFELSTHQFLIYPANEEPNPPVDVFAVDTEKTIMTWAPSHGELAVLSDLLHYANLVGGLSENIRRDLRYDLEITVAENDLEKNEFAVDEKRIADLDRRFRNPNVFLGYDKDGKGNKISFFCIELCAEYIDYLKEILKPYMK